MVAFSLTQDRKGHAVLVALDVNHSDSEIATILNVARSFVLKVRKELVTHRGDVSTMAKRKKHSQQTDVVRTAEFVQQVQETIIDDPSMSMRSIAQHLQVTESTIRCVMHGDLRYQSYVMRRGQFMSDKTRENCSVRSRRLLNELKHPEEPDML